MEEGIGGRERKWWRWEGGRMRERMSERERVREREGGRI